VSFREGGAAALEWAASYLERVGELPVLAQVEPDMLRDLDEILPTGVTHWQSPRFFAYFSNSAYEAGILAELPAATLNSVAFLWRTAPAATELELWGPLRPASLGRDS
jgi:aromatic-L-amino-acid/L-tryptophan decarboxylase